MSTSLKERFNNRLRRRAEARELKKSASLISRRRIRLRLIIAVPALTSLLVLGLGLIIVDLNSRELLNHRDFLSQKDFTNQLETTMNHMVIVIVIGSVIALVSGLALALTIMAPIRRLARDTASIARGDLTRSIRLEGEGEIALLGSAFNEMISSINRYLLKSMTSGVLTINDKGNVTSISADAEFILGVSSERVIGARITRIFPEIPENEPFLKIIDDTLAQRHTVSNRELSVSTDTRDNIPISISTSLLRDRDNTLVGLIISFEDAAHLRKVHDQMRKVDRLTTLGGLAAGIAHQVRNPLCSIRGLAQLLSENRGENPTINEYSEIILKDVDRIDGVVERLLRFLQPTSAGWTAEDMNEIIRDSLALGRHEIRGRQIDIVENLAADLPRTPAQRENLIQAFLNIIVNSFQAMEAGTLTVTSELVASDNHESDSLRILFADTGPGIAAENMKSIFEPSFTTKDNGAGFGLVITRQTVEAHGGSITVDSAPGKGACFIISLPIRSMLPEGEDAIDVASTT